MEFRNKIKAIAERCNAAEQQSGTAASAGASIARLAVDAVADFKSIIDAAHDKLIDALWDVDREKLTQDENMWREAIESLAKSTAGDSADDVLAQQKAVVDIVRGCEKVRKWSEAVKKKGEPAK